MQEVKFLNCSHIEAKGQFSHEMIKLSGNNVLNLCEDCHAHLRNDILGAMVKDALQEAMVIKVSEALSS